MTSKIQKQDTKFVTDFLPEGLSDEERARAFSALGQTQVAIGRGLDWAAHFKALKWPYDTAIICDNQTWEALAKDLSNQLNEKGYRVILLNIGSSPRPTMELAEYITTHATNCAALIGVGSGTINDLTKFAAHKLAKPYAICGTAPSMNGYLSANAAILAHGHKKSLPAALPAAALFDLDILDHAPQRLKNAGLGDSICRATAQVDWLISHHLLGTVYDELPFKLLAPYEEAMLAGDSEALILTLLLSGLGMTIAGGSYPASQGEHLLSHYMEMRFPDIAHKSYHGEQIAVTTLYMAELQEKLFAMDSPPQLALSHLPDDATLLTHFGAETGREVLEEWHKKRAKMNDFSMKNWSELRKKHENLRISTSKMSAALEKTGAPLSYNDLGFNAAQWQEITHYAPYIRNRFTSLDIALLAGI